ncbi:MAG: hypothetical protein JXA33_10855 [Anaerolineae bacterium]|nr:hypothetical protein [Anaerolineae bacterium]
MSAVRYIEGDHPQLAGTTGDPLLDLYAMAWKLAFTRAALGDLGAQQEIVTFFGLRRAKQLYRCRCIPWNPVTVLVQGDLFEGVL